MSEPLRESGLCDLNIVAATRYKTDDGKWWDSLGEAERWARWLLNLDDIHVRWEAGESLGQLAERYPHDHSALPSVGLRVPPELAEVTKSAKFVISHWQCAEHPVYSILCFRSDGDVVAGGKPYADREWPQWWSNEISLRDLARHRWEVTDG